MEYLTPSSKPHLTKRSESIWTHSRCAHTRRDTHVPHPWTWQRGLWAGLFTSKDSSSAAWAMYLLITWAAAIAGTLIDDSSWTSRWFPLLSIWNEEHSRLWGSRGQAGWRFLGVHTRQSLQADSQRQHGLEGGGPGEQHGQTVSGTAHTERKQKTIRTECDCENVRILRWTGRSPVLHVPWVCCEFYGFIFLYNFLPLFVLKRFPGFFLAP